MTEHNNSFPRLRSPGHIGEVLIKNRLLVSPMHTMLADVNGQVTSPLIEFYKELAIGGAALVVAEYAYVDEWASQSNVAQLSAASDQHIPGLARLAEAIHHGGSHAALQLSYAGRQRFLAVEPIVAPSRVPWQTLHEAGVPVPKELTIEEIGGIVVSFGRAAMRAKQAGFDVLELHAGHGGLINQFLSPLSNRRGDLYGGPLKDRQRFLREVVRAVLPAGLPVIARLSAYESESGGLTFEETLATARMLETDGIAAIDMSAGDVQTVHLQVQPMGTPVAPNAASARAAKEILGIPVLFAGSITSPDLGEALLSNGDADFLRLGRPLLADPRFPRKALAGKAADITPCIRCNECLDSGTSLLRHIRCAVNFDCGRESLRRPLGSARSVLSVAVIGGGPAGLEAAFRATIAGHKVVLFERSELGGALNRIARPDFKKELLGYRDFLIRRIDGRIEIAGQAGRPELDELMPDLVLLATGAEARVTPVDLPTVDSRSAIVEPLRLGEAIVVDGADRFSVEVAIYIARSGVEVTVIGEEAILAGDVGSHTRVPLIEEADAVGVRWLPASSIIDALDGTCRVVQREGQATVLRCDALVTTQFVPDYDMLSALEGGPWQTMRIGDCVAPRRIIHAIEDANVALKLSEEERLFA